MSDVVVVALIVGVVGPVTTQLLTGRQRRREREEARREAKQIADRVATVAVRAAESDVKLDSIVEGNGKIHDLVNSRFTAVMDARKVDLEILLELQKSTGASPAAVERTEKELADLNITLGEA